MVSACSSNCTIDIYESKENSIINYNIRASTIYNKYCIIYKENNKQLDVRKFFTFLENRINHITKNVSVLKNISCVEDFIVYKKVALFLRNRPLPFHTTYQSYRDKFLFHDVVHTILRGYSNPKTTDLQKKYGLQHSHYQSFISTKQAFCLLEQTVIFQNYFPGLSTHQEQESLLRICQDRYNHLGYVRTLETYVAEPEDTPLKVNLRKKLLDYITTSISFLYDPNHPSITLLENGSTCFSIAGGWNQHYVGFQFIRDKAGSYYFSLENRDGPSQDPRFHGWIGFYHQDKMYTKSRVHIKVELDSISDPDFLLFLINNANLDSKEASAFSVYNYLYNHLMIKGKGRIVETENERLQLLGWDTTQAVSNAWRRQVNALFSNHLRFNKAYQRVHMNNTCLKSNTCGRETEMASERTRKALELYESYDLCRQMNIKYCFKLTDDMTSDLSPDNFYYSSLASYLKYLKRQNTIKFNSSSFLNRLDECLIQRAACQTDEARQEIEKEVVDILKELDDAMILFKHAFKRIKKLCHQIQNPSIQAEGSLDYTEMYRLLNSIQNPRTP